MGYTGDNRLKRASAGGGGGLLGGLFTKTSHNSNQHSQIPDTEVTLGNLGFGNSAGADTLLSPKTAIVCSKAARDDASSGNMGFGQKLRNLTGLNSSASSIKDGVVSSGVSIHTPSYYSTFSTVTSRPTTPNRNSCSSFAGILVSPNQRPPTPRRSITITIPENTELVNEFEGLDFTAIISSFLTEPVSQKTIESSNYPTQAKSQVQLENLADTASNLLERMYNAYLKRTEALGHTFAEQDALREELEGSRDKVRQLSAQMERMIEVQKKEKAERDEVMLDLVQEKVKIEEERLRREEEQEDWKEQERARLRDDIILELSSGENIIIEAVDLDKISRNKRVSSGGSSTGTSDSGFDSDSESLFSTGHGCSRTPEAGNGTLQPPPIKNGKIGTSIGVEKQYYSVRMVSLPTKCESCSRPINNSSIQSPSTPIQTSPFRLPTPLSPLRKVEPASHITILTQKENMPAQSRWGFSAFRSSNNNSVELDKLRTENKVLRARVGDLESSVSEVLGILGGWREVEF